MEVMRIMRRLRLTYGIRLKQLAQCAGVSTQYLSGLELGRFQAGPAAAALVRRTFEQTARQNLRQAIRFSAAVSANRDRLLEWIISESEAAP